MEWFFDLGRRHIHWTVRSTKDMYAFIDPANSKPAEISELIVLHNEDVAMVAYCGTDRGNIRISSDKLGMAVVRVGYMASLPCLEVVSLAHCTMM